MKLVNLDNGQVLAEQVRHADHFFARLKGLMFSKSLPTDHCLHILPCRSVHTFFMNYSIDILHLNKRLYIIGMDTDVQPGRMGKIVPGTYSVIEIAAGQLRKTETEVGHAVQFQN